MIIALCDFFGLVWGTPPLDPICGSPNSLERVLALRARRTSAKEESANRQKMRAMAAAPRLGIEKLSAADPLKLILEGPAATAYVLERSTDLTVRTWTPMASVILGDQPLAWSDVNSGLADKSFFRLRDTSVDALSEPASNFRLLDAQGVAHDLFYHTHRRGIVVLAAGTNLNVIASSAPLLNDLQRTYTNSIEVWVLLSDPAAVRSNVLAQAKALSITSPVLLDPNNIAARSVGLTRAGEVALIETSDFTIFYRGEAAGAVNPTASQSLLGRAVAGLVENAVVPFVRTETRGALLDGTGESIPDYSNEIAPTFYQFCAKCHTATGVAPFAMTNYSVIKDWALGIKHALLSNKMPPWHADPEFGHFTNDLSLPGHLKSALVRWLDAGAPRGEGNDPLADLPPPPSFDRWPDDLGEPDALVEIPVQPIRALGSEPYRYIFARAPNTSNVWLKAAVVRPSNYRSVHHYLVWKDRIGNQGSGDVSTYEAHIAEFVPGYEPFRLPADAGVFLTRSNWLTFNLHYTPYGVETNDRPVLALWYHKAAPAKTWEPANPGNATFSIPPQARDYPVQVEWTAPTRVTLYRFNPHMHLRGKRVKYEAVYPGGKREVLLSVPDYDFNWQIGYALAEPKILEAGTRIIISGAFDNSPQNLANPDPTARVRWGDQSWMEMFVGFMDYTR